MPSATAQDLRVEPVDSVEDIKQGNYAVSEAFGRQINDAVWGVMNPGWDTPEGQTANASKLAKRWESATINKDGKPNTVVLKATLPDPEDATKSRVAGMAIWLQLSVVEGHGDKFSGRLEENDLEGLTPQNKRFASQMFHSLWKRRVETMQEKANASPPAIFVLDMCAVDPAYQRRGIAQALVRWGLDEAKERGGLECTTEASTMGRGAYKKLGFQDEGAGDIVFEVDREFDDWDKPPNVFLRTGPQK